MARRRSTLPPFIWGYAAGLATMLLVLWGAGAFHLSSVSASHPVETIAVNPRTGQRPVRNTAPDEMIGGTSGEDQLIQRHIALPIAGLKLENIQDTFNDARGGTRRHQASDILSPRGTPVMAVDAGTIQKLFTSKQGGLTIYQFDPEGTFCYYYAHLDHYAADLQEGAFVERGHVIGYVGTTGNAPANTPHLHFAVFKLGADKRWWHGTPINPFPALVSHFKE
jgi:murein DD-endopeptidase MepM/ murein hydrolase activator NlpD